MDALARIQPYAAGTGSAITEVMMGLDTVELVMAFEEAFELEIPNAEAERMRTVRDVVDYIAKPEIARAEWLVYHANHLHAVAALSGNCGAAP